MTQRFFSDESLSPALPWGVAGLAVGLLIGGLALRDAPETGGWASYSGVYERVAPSVVNVAVSGDEAAVGSGFAVGPQLVVTARHVVAEGQGITVRDLDGDAFSATLLGSDARTDLALLQLDQGELVPAELGRSSLLSVGQVVLAIGNPYGLGHSVAQGVVGGRQRAVDGAEGAADFVQLSIPLNPGNSGGPVVDEAGRVVGVLAGTHAQGQAIAFAVPVDVLSAALPALMRGDQLTRAWLGLRTRRGDEGLRVDAVVSGGPADRAGVREGDVLVAVAGEPVADAASLTSVLDRLVPLGKVELQLLRDGAASVVPVVLEDRASQSVVASGMTLRARPGAGGEVVAVRPESRSARAGVLPGDVVRVVGGYVVQSPADVQDLLSGRAAVQIELLRGETAVRVSLEPL